jgi:hypothetical protein
MGGETKSNNFSVLSFIIKMETKKTMLAMVLGIFLLASVTALTIYPGETYYEDLTDDIEGLNNFTCNLTAQTYNLDGSNLTMNETGWILSLDTNFKPDNLTMDCLLNGEKWVSSGGGSSKKYYKWECSSWGQCMDNFSLRTCERIEVDYKNELGKKPSETIGCRILENKTEVPKPTCEELDNCPIEEPAEEKEQKDNFDRNAIIFSCIIILIFGSLIIRRLILNKRKKKIIK